MLKSDSFLTNKKRQIKLITLKNILRNEVSLNFSIPLKNQEISNAEEIIPMVNMRYILLYSLQIERKTHQPISEIVVVIITSNSISQNKILRSSVSSLLMEIFLAP